MGLTLFGSLIETQKLVFLGLTLIFSVHDFIIHPANMGTIIFGFLLGLHSGEEEGSAVFDCKRNGLDTQ